MRRTRSVWATAVLLAASGCAGGSTPPPVPVPEDAPGRAAAMILNDCRDRDPAVAMACHERAVLAVLENEGVASAMAVAERMGDLDREVERQGHVYAHAIGLAAYTTPEEVGTVFASCTPSFQSGCYHGVIQSYFADVASGNAQGVDAEAINLLCADQRGAAGDRWLLFQCAHGIGHGVTMIADHHLPSALEACDLIRDGWEREACYGGAFMENIVQATTPHHTTGRPQLAGDPGHGSHDAQPAEEPEDTGGTHAHGGHGDPAEADHQGHPGEARPDFPGLVPDDPLYPCNVLPDRYLVSCYQMQTSAILFYNGGDFAAAGEACEAAPERYQPACFRSIGRDVSATTVQRHPEALELCGTMGDRRFDCHYGYVKNVVDVTARIEDGFAFCAIVPEDEGKRRCYEAVGEQVSVIADEEQERASMCAVVGTNYADDCRRGAGVRTTALRPSAPGA